MAAIGPTANMAKGAKTEEIVSPNVITSKDIWTLAATRSLCDSACKKSSTLETNPQIPATVSKTGSSKTRAAAPKALPSVPPTRLPTFCNC